MDLDCDSTTVVLDEPRSLQQPRDDGDALTTHAKHLRQEFLCEVKLVRSDSIAGHEQPPAPSLLLRQNDI